MAAVAAAVALALPLVSCATEPPTWQVVGVYVDPALPGDLPSDAAGKANFQLNDDELRGTTPCADVHGTVALDGGGASTNRRASNTESSTNAAPSHAAPSPTLTLQELTVDAPHDTCTGGARHTHDQLSELLRPGASFEVLELSDHERLLISTTNGNGTNPPSIRLMML